LEDSERFEALSAEETAVLRTKRHSALLMFFIAPLSYLLFGALAIFIRSWLYIILYFLLATIPVLIALLSAFLRILSLNKDIREGKKKILISRVESQRQDIRDVGSRNNSQMSYTYLVKLHGKEMKVSEAQYYQCKSGQMVEIHLAPNSKEVFSLNVLKDSMAEFNSPAVSV
jgi:hypothetical protein